MNISIVIPAYNESKRISRTLDKIIEYIKQSNQDFHVYIIDDASSDNTKDIVNEYLSQYTFLHYHRLDKNLGKGGAVLTGLAISHGDYVLFTDADLSTPINNIENLLLHIPDYDIVIGSRRLDSSNITVKQPPIRRFIHIFGANFRRIFLLSDVLDTQCGFKLFNRKSINLLKNYDVLRGYAFDIELLTIAKANKLRIKEVGVLWSHDNHGNFPVFRASLEILRDIFYIKYKDFFGKYKSYTGT